MIKFTILLIALLVFIAILPCRRILSWTRSSPKSDADMSYENLGLASKKLRVMTFNTWLSGRSVEDGLLKIAKHIKKVEPDIVALQEVQNIQIIANLTALLGKPWNGVHHVSEHPDTAIFTKHNFIKPQLVNSINLTGENEAEDLYGVGASIKLDTGSVINFFSMHLNYLSYGPYAANNKMVTSAKQIMVGERNKDGNSRAQNIEQLMRDETFKKFMAKADKVPLIVAGDFNCPSHLDWTEETKDIHGGWVFEWPATKLMTDAGFIDSYRHLHPDVKKDPGYTWSTVQKSSGWEWDYTIPEPQDRIDFIFYRGPKEFTPISSRTYSGDVPLKPIPDHWKNSYPSDHFALITEFELGESVRETMASQKVDIMLKEQKNLKIDDGIQSPANKNTSIGVKVKGINSSKIIIEANEITNDDKSKNEVSSFKATKERADSAEDHLDTNVVGPKESMNENWVVANGVANGGDKNVELMDRPEQFEGRGKAGREWIRKKED